MTTALATPNNLGKIGRNRVIRQSRASGYVARRATLPEYLDFGEVQTMLAHAPHGQAALAMLIQWRAGLRIGEVLALEPGDLLFDGDFPGIRVRNGKGGRARLAPAHRELIAALHAFLRYAPRRQGPILPYTPSAAWRWVKTALLAAQGAGHLEGRNVSTHTFRHSAARHWLANGCQLNEVQRWLGHASLMTTAVYLEILPDPMGHMERVP